GKVSFIPETLNFYRRHEATVSYRSVREATQAYESLLVKAKIFETYSVTPRAITSSLARSELEYDTLTRSMKLDRPAFRANPELTGVLDRIHATLNRRLNDSALLRITSVPGERKAS